MSTLFLPPSVRSNPKSLGACLCAILIASPGTLFAKDAHSAVKPGMHFYLNTKGSFGCFSKKALVEHVKHLKMGNGPEAKQLQEDDLYTQCYSPYGKPLALTEYAVVDVESVSGVDGLVVGFDFPENPKDPPPVFTLMKYVTPAQTHKSSDAE